MQAKLEQLIDQMITDGVLFEDALKEFEKRFILDMLDRKKHNLSKAASALGIHRNTLTKRLRDYEQGARKNGARRHIAPRKKTTSRKSQ
jgi:Fis family transcriptional regulator, factor for inversion stimulation protein